MINLQTFAALYVLLKSAELSFNLLIFEKKVITI